MSRSWASMAHLLFEPVFVLFVDSFLSFCVSLLYKPFGCTNKYTDTSEGASQRTSSAAKSVRDWTNERTSERICIELCITIVSSSLCTYISDVHWLTHPMCTVSCCYTHSVRNCSTHKHTQARTHLSLRLFCCSLLVCMVSFSIFEIARFDVDVVHVSVCVCVSVPMCAWVWVYVRTFRTLNFLSLAQKSIWLVAIASRTINGMRVEVSFVNKKKVFAMKRKDMTRRQRERNRYTQRERENGKETYTKS